MSVSRCEFGYNVFMKIALKLIPQQIFPQNQNNYKTVVNILIRFRFIKNTMVSFVTVCLPLKLKDLKKTYFFLNKKKKIKINFVINTKCFIETRKIRWCIRIRKLSVSNTSCKCVTNFFALGPDRDLALINHNIELFEQRVHIVFQPLDY